MNHSFFTKILLGGLLLLLTANATNLQAQEAQPDLATATILCDKRPVTIPLFNGAGADTNEGDGTCMTDITETNTTWFTWTGKTDGNFSFRIEPSNPNDRIAFVLFDIPTGGEPVALRCGEACFPGATGLVEGDNDANVDCQNSPTDAFARALSMQEGLTYGLLIENTTSNEGFTIVFGGEGEVVGPVGNILPSATEACFGQSLTFDNDIVFPLGTITQYEWLVEDGEENQTRTTQEDIAQTFEFATSGMKRIELTVTTNTGCNAIFERFISINSCCDSDNGIAIDRNPTITEIACPDDTNGAIDITVTNDSNFPTVFEWSNGETSEDLMGLAPDTYMITVSNAAGCRDSIEHTFVIPNALTAEETVVAPSCGGLADGSITISASGGRMPYFYDFGDGNGFVPNATLNGLDTGDYTVIVRDNSGCTKTIEAIELDDRALNIMVGDPTNPTCGDLTDGSIEISADNAMGVLTFDFNDGNGPLDPTSLTRLDSGSYIIDVFDSEGCTGNPVEFTLTKPERINLSIESRPGISCFGENDGTAIVAATGGIGDYSYLWSTGATTRSIGNLAPGAYTVTVTDGNGCTAERTSATLVEPPLLTASVANVQDVSCSTEENGMIELTMEGGTMPYMYSTDGLTFAPGTTISNLAIGDYDITVVDNNGCMVMLNASINSPATISFDVSSAIDICYGESLSFTNTSTFTQGNITEIAWNFGTGTVMGDNVAATFTTIGKPVVELTVTTDLGCTEVLTRELDISVAPCCDQDNGVSFLPIFEEPLCNGTSEGSITLNPSSIPPITTIEWSNNATTETIDNLPAGIYTVVVTNDATCESTETITLEEPTLITTSLDLTNPTCAVATNGAIAVTATGGTLDPGNAYDFDFGNGFSTDNRLDNLAFGSFSVMVRDDNNCVVTVDTELVVPDTSPISATLDLVSPTCDVALNGAITVQPTGQSVGANLLYDFGNGFTTSNTTGNLSFGDYTIQIQDTDNCILTIDTNLVISSIPPINATLAVVPVSCAVATNGSITVQAQGMNNSDLVYNFGDGFAPENTTENLATGDYTIQIRDDNNCVLRLDTTIAVSDVPPINASLAITRPSCEEATNGRIIVNALGITNSELVYDFGDGFSTQNASQNLPVGNYPITVQDRDNCTLRLDTTLTVDPDFVPVTATFTNITQPSCGGGVDGSITVIPGGESGSDLTNYTFDFGNGELNVNTSSNLAAGPQLVVIRNINNCSITLDTTLSEPVLEPTFIVARPTCFGLSDGSIIIDVPTPGQGPYIYDFGDGNDFQSEAALTNLPQGTYSIQVQDANLCLSEQLAVLIDQPDELLLTTVSTDISCFGENDGRIVAEVTGGVGNYSYDWSDGQTSNIASNLGAGDYFLAVLDGNDCPVTSDLVPIIEPAELTVEVGQIDNVLCFGEMNGAISINAMGGSAPFEYSLDGIIFQPTATLGGLTAGDYTVIVKDSRACEVPTENVTIAEPEEFIVTANVDDPITKLGFPINLSAEANSTDGSINYTWAIPDSVVCNNCANFTTVPPGSATYTVTAVNSENCQATASISVQVSTDRPVYIPNIFSPNGDGINDEFFIPFSPAMTGIKELKIFDRSGALVFEAFDIVEGEEFLKAWDGEFNGTKIKQGVFVVAAQIDFVDGQRLPYQSDVTLITSE